MTDHTHQNDPARTPGEKALADWREAVAKEIAALEASDAAPGNADLQQVYKAAVEQSRQVARLAWTRIVCPADVRVRAEIARHCLWPAYHGERRFEAVLGGEEFNDGLELAEFDERAVAELVKGVLWTASAAPARGHGEPAPGERPRMPQLTDKDLDEDDAIPVPMPEEAPIMVDDAKAAIDAARLLWTSNNLDDRSPDRRVDRVVLVLHRHRREGAEAVDRSDRRRDRALCRCLAQEHTADPGRDRCLGEERTTT